jgi:D-xylose transport system substrate-binding protein
LRSITHKAARTACAGSAALVLATCCSCSGNSSSGSSRSASSTPPQLAVAQINNSFSAMSALKPLAAEGHGSIAVILPRTATAIHFGESDAQDLVKSFQKAGLKTSQYKVQIRQGSDQLAAAKKAITDGASVLIVDARYSGVGADIESYARAHRVPVIDYDWLTSGGSRTYYVGFDSLKVGVLLGQGLVSCVSAWGVKHPQIIIMTGGPTDYNVPLYAQGYDAVLARQFSTGWKDVSNPPGTWDSHIALGEFEQQYTAHKNINAALIPNDETGAPIIRYLQQTKHIKARTFPTTGLDATPDALRSILAGYQCGTVYKPIYLEAQAAAALAMYVRAGVAPPSLLNGNIPDSQTNTPVASVLLTPEWVTAQNMNSTVIADKFVQPSGLCSSTYTSACSAAGISG